VTTFTTCIYTAADFAYLSTIGEAAGACFRFFMCRSGSLFSTTPGLMVMVGSNRCFSSHIKSYACRQERVCVCVCVCLCVCITASRHMRLHKYKVENSGDPFEHCSPMEHYLSRARDGSLLCHASPRLTTNNRESLPHGNKSLRHCITRNHFKKLKNN